LPESRLAPAPRGADLWYEFAVRAPALALLAVAWTSARAAADERELTLSVAPAASLARLDGNTGWGGGGGLDLAYWITDAVAVRATGSFAAHALGGGAALLWNAGVGVTYAIDIVRVVPSLDFALGLVGARRNDTTSDELGLQVGIGVDYLVSRRLAIGAVLRYFAFLTAASELPAWVYVGPRITIHFLGD
jgi:outer membrane protein W